MGAIDVYKKELEEGGIALGFFNRGDIPHTVKPKLERIGIAGSQNVRDLWRQKDLGMVEKEMDVMVQPHNVMLYKFTKAK